MHLYDAVRPRTSRRLPLYQQTCQRASPSAHQTFFGLSQRLVITRTRERKGWARDSFSVLSVPVSSKMSPDEPTSPSKANMVRRANMLVVQLAVAPVIYLIIAALLELGGASFATDPGFVLQVLSVLIFLSLAVTGITVFVQTSKSLMSGRARYDPIRRAFQIMSLGAILSEQHAVLGLILTFLSGSIFYLVGFSLVAWASLWWVRQRFMQNLGTLPNA